MSLVIAIDGPSGVGKSTVARRLARELGVPYLNTGAMYRALGLEVVESGLDPQDEKAVCELLQDADISLEAGEDGVFRVLLDGQAAEDRLYTQEVARVTSVISTYTPVRERLVALQRECGRRHGAVVEGRDIGTRVFPETPYKFFVDARPEVRHERRYRQLVSEGTEVGFSEVAAELDRRDERDRARTDSPLSCDDSYVAVDTSDLSADQVVEKMLRILRARG